MGKTVLSWLIVLSVILCNFPIAYAGGTSLLLTAPDAIPNVGEEFEVTVSISGNPGLASIQFELFYDADALKCTEIKTGAVLNDMMTAMNTTAAAGEKTSAVVSAAGTSNTTEDGVLTTFAFEVVRASSNKVTFSVTELRDEKGKNIDHTYVVSSKIFEQAEQGDNNNENSPSSESSTGSKNDTGIESNLPSNPIIPTNQEIVFADVSDSHWAYSSIRQAVSLGLIRGYSDGTFAPEKNMTRAEFVTLLWLLAEKPCATNQAAFSDVQNNAWYAPQIAWAAENDLVKGVSSEEFQPFGTITRQQAMAILYRYSGKPAVPIERLDFGDIGEISSYAEPAMYWAVNQGLIKGISDIRLAPNGMATRAQLAAIFVRYLDSI